MSCPITNLMMLMEKSQHFGADGGDACGCRDPLGGVVMVTPAACLRVKNLNSCGLNDGSA